MDDIELLRRYLSDRSEDAFAELVRRHLSFVYRTALRQCSGDEHRAQDAAQMVFALLARKAPSLTRHRTLIGWLFTTTRLTMRDFLRSERRRQWREEKAQADAVVVGDDPNTDEPWNEMRPLLDQALSELNRIERDAVLLRYFGGLSFAEVGARLRLNEDAARMRVRRALERLRVSLSKRGIASTVAAVASLMTQEAEAVAPVQLASRVTSLSLAASGAAGGWIGGTALSQTLKPVLGLTGSVGLAGLVFLASLATAIHARLANSAAQAALVEAQREFNASMQQLQSANPANPKDGSAAPHMVSHHVRPRPHAHASDPLAEGQKFLRAHPEARAYMLQGNFFLGPFSPFARRSGLSHEALDRLGQLLRTYWVESLSISPNQIASEGIPDPARLEEVLGPSGTHAFVDYLQTLRYAYVFTQHLAAEAAADGEPLSDSQNDAIADILAASSTPLKVSVGPLSPPDNLDPKIAAVDWDDVSAQVQRVLSSSQYNAVENRLQAERLKALLIQSETAP